MGNVGFSVDCNFLKKLHDFLLRIFSEGSPPLHYTLTKMMEGTGGPGESRDPGRRGSHGGGKGGKRRAKRSTGVQFNRNVKFWAQKWVPNWGKFWENFSTGALYTHKTTQT